MRAVIQRVKKASVTVDGQTVGRISKGLVVLIGIGEDDREVDIHWLAGKIIGIRIFEDADGKMNLSIQDIKGELLLISQFTLYGDCRKGKRPSFSEAAPPERAKALFEQFVSKVKENYDYKVETGVFQADMDVELINNGPVTIMLDSKKQF